MTLENYKLKIPIGEWSPCPQGKGLQTPRRQFPIL